ncbi:hypothetical protein N0V90_004497 [Kalmusia sp. IMI 367209]|nr:hypothetical protein N0V90_004497 [Kalmusia sp. IMI 367209]
MSFTIVITGVSSGLGFKLAAHALKQGATVLGTVRNPERASSVLSELSFISSKFHSINVDMTDAARLPTVIADTIKQHGPIDILINNAGYSVLGPLEHITNKQARHQIETNFFGPLALIQAILPHFRERKAGTIVNITSVAGLNGLPSCGLYAASKFALEGMSESLASEVGPLGIRVILVEPGAFRTEFLSSSNLILGNDGKGWDAYQGNPATTVIQKMQSMAGKQTGDPDKAAERIWDVVSGTGLGETLKGRGSDGKVLRVLLGSDSLVRMKTAIDLRQETLKDLEEVAKSCDY